MPEAIVIGGANGAGKSTFARYVLPVEMPFLNADEIAKTLPIDFAGNRERESGRQLLGRMDDLAAASRSFAVETTLSGRSLAPRLRALQEGGYAVVLIFVWGPSPELSVERVAGRVRSGGHDIPESTIHRRHAAGLYNLVHTYLPIADSWHIFSNFDTNAPYVVACQRAGQQERIVDPAIWQQIVRQGDSLSVNVRAPRNHPSLLWNNTGEITRRFTLGVREVVRDHALSGNPVATWRNGAVTLLLPDEVLRNTDTDTEYNQEQRGDK